MIAITGAAGFIGYNMVQFLNEKKFRNLVLVDDFTKEKNSLDDCQYLLKVHRSDFHQWLKESKEDVEFIIHLGARTNTMEKNREVLNTLNVEYSKKIWNLCVLHQIPLIYASSAATYGLGEHGFMDDEGMIHKLTPLNLYGESKLIFDQWAIHQDSKPFFWCGLKFFNVYGYGENHKGKMASVVWHAYHQITKTGQMKLFRSHHPDYKDGEQKRDFISVHDVVEVIYWFMKHRKDSGIYNLGTGKAGTFSNLTKAVFRSMELEEKISFIDTPEELRSQYQYFTQANMKKLRSVGYDNPFLSLEEGISKYIKKLRQY